MVVALHRGALESALIEMPVPHRSVCDPPPHRMGLCEPTNESRHLIVSLRPDGEVPMIRRDAVGEDTDRVTLVRLDHDAVKRTEVGVLSKTGASCQPIGSAHDGPARRVLFAPSLAWVRAYRDAVVPVKN